MTRGKQQQQQQSTQEQVQIMTIVLQSFSFAISIDSSAVLCPVCRALHNKQQQSDKTRGTRIQYHRVAMNVIKILKTPESRLSRRMFTVVVVAIVQVCDSPRVVRV